MPHRPARRAQLLSAPVLSANRELVRLRRGDRIARVAPPIRDRWPSAHLRSRSASLYPARKYFCEFAGMTIHRVRAEENRFLGKIFERESRASVNVQCRLAYPDHAAAFTKESAASLYGNAFLLLAEIGVRFADAAEGVRFATAILHFAPNWQRPDCRNPALFLFWPKSKYALPM